MRSIKYVLAVFLFTCFLLPTTGYSQDKEPEIIINYKDQDYATFSDEEIEKILNRKANFTVVANKMATTFVASKTLTRTDVVLQVNIYISTFLKLDRKKDNTKEIISFWNTYSKYLICSTEYRRGRTSEHVLKRAVSTHTHSEMFFKYLMKFGPGVIDFNAVEIVDGEEETLIDFIDKIIASKDFDKNYNTGDVETLRASLSKHFNAKKASELKTRI